METGTTDTRRTLRVHQKRWEAAGITSITLVDPAGGPLPTWRPGAHLALHLPNGLVREYSLCSDPADATQWTVAVLRAPDSRGGSSLIHDQLPVGAEIEVDGPRNAFRLEESHRGSEPKHYLIAGGIGITPIIAMTRELAARGADWSLLYTGRSRAQMAFLAEVTQLPAERVHVHVDDEEGRFADLTGILGAQDPRTIVYCCGPAPLMDAVAAAMPLPENLRLERFKAPEPVVDPDAEADHGFDVVVHSTGQRVPVGAEHSILDALADVGVQVPASCMEGICGTCETGVLSGEIDHRDYLLTDEEKESGQTMCICVSRCRGAELVLDI
ncbi:PDR/VanB family oxidoreductase [Granulicoccus phenolivorans]|uniref:PDR/VanB family oxidoreductase n=1 Tax=Granulicoccus phenolivorans TaxID=266854 RepID=UPI00042457A0|nr:PDR/VanB family oxidoreductase [Granulicoccus phenolivorans]